MAVVLPFNRLLNTISHKMNKSNLRSLIHLCQQHIPESKREEITHGWEVFQILKQQNVIGDDLEETHNLLQIMRDMKPKRRDIIKIVKDYIRHYYDPSYEFESSIESYVYAPPAVLVDNRRLPTQSLCSSGLESGYEPYHSSTSVEVNTSQSEKQCMLDCCCFRCNCYSRQIPPCVLLIIAFIMAIITFLAIVLWFGKIPRNLYSKLGSDGVKAGPFVVGCFCVLALAPLCWWIKRKVSTTSHGHIPYRNLPSDSSPPDDVFGDQGKVCNRVSITGPTTPLRSSARQPIKKSRRRPGMDSATGDSSINTAASESILVREPRLPPVTSQQMSYPEGGGLVEDGGLHTDGACCSEESDYDFQSRESLFPVESDDSEYVVPPTTAA